MVTGESLPVEKSVGDEVVGGTLNTDGRLVVEVTRIGRDTLLARIRQSVVDAQTGKAPIQRLADRISAVFVPGRPGDRGRAPSPAWLLTGNDTDAAMTAARQRAGDRLPLRARPGHARPPCWSAPAAPPSSAS